MYFNKLSKDRLFYGVKKHPVNSRKRYPGGRSEEDEQSGWWNKSYIKVYTGFESTERRKTYINIR